MAFLTKFSGMLLIAAAATVIVLAIVDTAPEASNAAAELRMGGPGSSPQPIATSVKYKIGGEVVFDVMVLVVLGLFGWFLYTSEVQQTWAVVLMGLLLVGSIVIRSTPLLSMDIGRYSPGCAFWGAYVIDDYYAPAVPRQVRTFPQNNTYRFGFTTRITDASSHPAQSVVLNFGGDAALAARWDGMPGAARLTGKLAGTRTILDYDNEKVVYSVPHLVVTKVESLGAGGG